MPEPLTIHEDTAAPLYMDLKGLFPGIDIWWMDYRYRWLDIGDWVSFLSQVRVNEIPFLTEYFDCDDFAWAMKGLAAFRHRVNGIGFILGDSPEGPHAWTIFVAGGGPGLFPERPRAWYMLEPQSYAIAPIPPGLPGYVAKTIVF